MKKIVVVKIFRLGKEVELGRLTKVGDFVLHPVDDTTCLEVKIVAKEE